ncbi:transposase [Sphingomonas sp. CL5.1]|nr:transposase [Sphingomonas sp. CL5.1]
MPDNAYIETFYGSLRDECLNVHWFETIAQARQLIEAWRGEYVNRRRTGTPDLRPKGPPLWCWRTMMRSAPFALLAA